MITMYYQLFALFRVRELKSGIFSSNFKNMFEARYK